MYWSSLFIRLFKVHKKIKSIFKAFFWSKIDMKKIEAKVAWKEVCLLKKKMVQGFGKLKNGIGWL